VNDRTAPQNPRQRRRSASGPTRSIGIGIALVGLGFAMFAVYAARDQFAASDLEVPILLASIVLGVAGMYVVGANWLRIVRSIGGEAPTRSGMRWYYVGQLGKYIPGGLWAVLGRAELASRDGVARSIAYPSVVMSLITTYAAAAATGALFVAFTRDGIGQQTGWILASIAVIAATVLGLSETVVGRVNRITSRLGFTRALPSASPRLSASAIVLTMPAWLLIGAATALSARAIGVPAEFTEIVAATSYSWLAGFLVLPLPGGLGVREAVFIALWGGTTSEAAAIAVIARVVFVIVDLTGAAVSSLVARFGR
jgi:glycosyltransferase 2 family protein